MAGLLTGSSAVSGALAGFALGAVALVAGVDGAGLDVDGWVLAAVAGAAVVLDASRVPPPSVRRQVPQLWGRVFSARTTAVLYGSRLGVGPLTILRTWWWWVAAVLGALAGVGPSAAAGAVFGASRIVVMLAAGTKAGRLRGNERAAVAALSAIGLVVAAVAFVAPFGDDGSVAGRDGDATPAPARRSTTTTSPTTSTTLGPAPVDESLAASLPAEVGGGYERVADESSPRLGPLDLARAAAAERDASAERALLETRRFVRGHARAWRAPDGRVAYAAVYRFASGGDAAAYLVDGMITLEGRGARVYGLEAPEAGRGFSQGSSGAAGGEVAHGVAFVRADRFFLVFETSKDSAAQASGAQRLAAAVDAWQRRGNG
ncbi:MAG TPA: hypothetical protein VF230_16760 [Acidimicrobiales bacterium]